MTRALDREIISTRQQAIAELASGAPRMVLLTLAHHIDPVWMEEAYRRTRKDGAAGVDGVTAEAYEQRLHENLSDLLERFKSGRYRAPPVRRVHIPKDGAKNKTRPIGIPTLEDKVLQRAVLMVLEPVYEQDFLDCSYGFRPGRSAHQALGALWKGLMGIGGGWLIDVDIRSFFDSLDRTHLNAVLDQRVRDGVIRRSARHGERSEAERPPVGVGACVPPQWRSGRGREAAKVVCKAHPTRRQAIRRRAVRSPTAPFGRTSWRSAARSGANRGQNRSSPRSASVRPQEPPGGFTSDTRLSGRWASGCKPGSWKTGRSAIPSGAARKGA